ncbi:hypothetical protein JXH92_003674 [Salmonella enterica subsp. enterica serovar 4,[5],12:b:-]|nr:hypothetical protein [Salmonella enterica subsp. enterica serovar 4,[5],12:b:-]
MLPIENIKDEAEFKSVCNYAANDFARICEYIQKGYLKDIVGDNVSSSECDRLRHKYKNLNELINIVQNAAQAKAPQINI